MSQLSWSMFKKLIPIVAEEERDRLLEQLRALGIDLETSTPRQPPSDRSITIQNLESVASPMESHLDP